VRDVDADPVPAELLRRVDSGATAAEGIQHYVADVAAGVEDPLKQCERFLRLIAEPFLRL
jgi:hypothetical protein